MARNRSGGRRGAVKGRTQFRMSNGHYAKVDRATGRVLSIKADKQPYKGIVITAPPATVRTSDAARLTLPSFPQPRRRRSPGAEIATIRLPLDSEGARIRNAA